MKIEVDLAGVSDCAGCSRKASGFSFLFVPNEGDDGMRMFLCRECFCNASSILSPGAAILLKPYFAGFQERVERLAAKLLQNFGESYGSLSTTKACRVRDVLMEMFRLSEVRACDVVNKAMAVLHPPGKE
jgi:hypothetical protein